MKAEAIVYALLSGAAPVTSIVSARIYPVVLPEGVPFPAIVYELVSSVMQPRIDAASASHLYRSRIQVNLLGVDLAALITLRDAVVAALQFQRGAIAGATVHAVLADSEGPVTFNEQLGLFHRPLDFVVHHSAT